MTLLDHLLRFYPQAKRTTLRRMIQSRRVTINGTVARTLNQPVEPSDSIKVTDEPKAQQPRKPALPLPIVYEDSDVIVIDKPAGVLTSTVPREKRPTAIAMIRQYVADTEAQIGVVHRLDRDASGLLVFSKNHAAYLSLKQQFCNHSVDRVYLALVEGAPNPRQGMIDSRLVERADGTVRSTDQHARGERAITHYETISTQRKRSLLRVRLQTGKKHQIRVHLSERGVPIVNDPLYGTGEPQGRLMLAAVELAIDHPRTGKRMTFKIDPPELITNAAR